MRELFRFVGLAGVVLLLFGLVSYALTLRFDLWTGVHVAGGGILLASAVLLNLARFRRTVTSRGTRERARAFTGTFVFAGILVTVNLLAARHPLRYDATESKVHTLSDKTRAVIRSLDRPVEIVAFMQMAEAGRRELEVLIERYSAMNPHLTARFVDPVEHPEIATPLGVRRQGVIVAKCGSDTAQSSAESQDGLSEGAITNLILKVTRPGAKAVYVLAGHGEPMVEDVRSPGGLGVLAGALRGENFEVRSLLLSTAPKVPDDAVLVLVVGPRKPLLEHEVSELRAYLGRGGRALLMLDPATAVELAPLLGDFRVSLGDDMIVDREQIPFMGARLGLDPIVADFPAHPITRDFQERIVVSQARSVDASPAGETTGVVADVIARTSTDSWAEAGYVSMLATGRVEKGPGERGGPIPVAVAATAPAMSGGGGAGGSETTSSAAARGSRLVVLGDSDMATNANLSAFFNQEFLLNTVQWLTGAEDLIAERPRGLRPSRLQMTEADYRNLFRLGVLLLPESLLVLGLGVWWRRRSL